jgi:FecR protein
MTDDDRDDPVDRDALDSFTVPEPSRDLGDRFTSALAGVTATVRVTSVADSRRVWASLASIAAIAAVVAALAWPASSESGASSPGVRTTLSLGRRGVAVVEAGGRVAWEIEPAGATRVRQEAGSVFYRVEPGGAFVVATPAGDVAVRGTCFRVEVAPDGTVITVYEGKVAVDNYHGHLDLTAGDRAVATTDGPPRVAPPGNTAPVAMWRLLADTNARERAQAERIAALEAQLAAAKPVPSVEAIGPAREMKHPFDLSPADLADYAKQCKVLVDVPPIAGSTLMDQIIDDGMSKASLAADERAAVRRTIASFQAAYQTQLQELYRELTGEDASLDPLTLILEITQKTPPGDLAAAYEQISAERAGLRPVGKGTVIERYLRFAASSSDSFERQLAAEIGAARARVFRRTWGGVNIDPGCPTKGQP